MLGTVRRGLAGILTFAAAAPLVIGAPLGAQAQTQTQTQTANRTEAPARRPALVVFIAVDQMRADYFERFLPQLQGGLGRLYRGGAVFTNAYQDHAITETAPGHSVMLSGRFPEHTGIVTNSRGVPDPQAPLIGGGGDGASPFRFRGSVLIDWMRQSDPRSRALSVSRKDRGAILPIGRAHQSAFWYATDGRFTTSTYYADTLPAWVQRFNARGSVQRYAGAIWPLLLPASAYPEPDSVPQENGGRGVTFPHGFSNDSATLARNFPAYPAMDSLTAQLALEGIDAMGLGRGPQADLVSISFSTTDAVGHAFGPDSRELHDQIVRLDRYLGVFIDSLFTIRDSTTIIFALTADHGVQPNPEVHAARTHTAARRAGVTPAIRAANQAVRAAGAAADPFDFEEGIVTLDRAALAGTRLAADSLLDALARTIRAVPGVARVDRVRDLTRADTVRDDVARRWLHMLPSDFTADLVVTLEPFAYYSGNTVATHGSPNDLDAHVPEIFYGPWFVPGHYTQRALAADIAPTLAATLGVTPTEPLDGRAHREAVRQP